MQFSHVCIPHIDLATRRLVVLTTADCRTDLVLCIRMPIIHGLSDYAAVEMILEWTSRKKWHSFLAATNIREKAAFHRR
jgi:hypothetical protein